MSAAVQNPMERYQRWSAFLAKLRQRVDEICAETVAGGRALSDQDPTNIQPLKTAIAALDTRVDNIQRKMEKTWHDEDLDRIEGPDGRSQNAPEQAYNDWHGTERYINEAWATCKVRCMCEFLRAMWPHVDVALRKPVACTRCGAVLTPAKRDTSESITCAHCHTVNQVMPEPVVSTWFTEAPINLGVEQVLAHRFSVLRAGEDVKNWIDAEYRRTRERPAESVESKQRREAMARAYYVAFAAAKAQIKPASPEEQAAEVEKSLQNFRRSLE
jgi:hypothetical protein